MGQRAYDVIVSNAAQNAGLSFRQMRSVWRLKCVKFYFGRGSLPDTAAVAHDAPPAGAEGDASFAFPPLRRLWRLDLSALALPPR